MEPQPREIRNYETAEGRSPFAEWLDCLRDMRARVKIEKRVERVKSGNLGDYRSLKQGVFELRIDYGSGYRVYFGQIGSTIIVILCGGDKSTQEQDILTAREYWRDYERRENPNQ